jgi:hypothetical protein
VVILAPKREGKGPKIPLNPPSSNKRPVTRKNPDPEPVAAVPDPEKILRKPKVLSGQSSLSKGKFSSENPQAESSEIIKTQSNEDLKPESEIKPVVVSDIVSFPSNVSELNPEQKKLLIELIKQEYPDFLPVTENSRGPSTGVKSEPETPSSSFESFSSEDFGSHYFSFDNPLFLSPLANHSPEEKSPSAEDQNLVTVHISCNTQGTLSPAASPILLTPIALNTANMAADRMDQIVAARYAPLVLPQVMYAFPPNDYMKYLPRFNGDGSVTAEEHLSLFYSFADNFNVEHADVWMRLFVQSLNGEARKWFRSLPANSIADIVALDEAFLNHWADKKDFQYYITEFGALRRKPGESIPDFTKRFNQMYGKIPEEIKPSETSAKITFSNAFDVEFSLLLRERRTTTLSLMQDAAIEVESNILAADKLKSRSDRDRKKKKEELPSSSNSTSDTKMDEMDKMLKTLTSEMARLKMEQRQPNRPAQEGSYRNPNQFRRPNNVPQILPRERKNQDDQKVLPPFQNNAVDEEVDEDDTEEDPAVHLNDSESSPLHVTQ